MECARRCMSENVRQTIYVVSIACAYTGAIFTALAAHKTKCVSDPLFLPFASVVWTACVVAVIVTAATTVKDPHPPFGAASWFVGGWKTGLSIFGVPIDTWWKYTLVLNYQITRSVLGSLLGNIFYPFLTVEVRAPAAAPQSRAVPAILLAQTSSTLFFFFASVTDTFLFLSQCDISFIALGVGMTCDAFITHALMSRHNLPQKRPPPFKRVGPL